MGPQPGRAGTRLPLGRDRRCGRASGRGARRARLGQLAVVGLLRVGLAHRAVDPRRGLGHHPGPAPLGQQRPDDALLPRRRARGQARVGAGAAARAPAPRRARAHGAGRHGDRRGDLPRLQRRRLGRTRLGRRHVNGHRVRARCAGFGRPGRDAPARAPADDRRRGRPAGAGGDRHGLYRARLLRAARRGRRALRRPARAALGTPDVAHARRGRTRSRGLGRAARVGHRSGDRGSGGRARHERLPARAHRPRAGHRADALVPRAADPGARALGPARRDLVDLVERPAAVPPASLDELRDRAALRAGQRRCAHRRRPARRRRHLADHAGHRLRLPRGQARRLPPQPGSARAPFCAGGAWGSAGR